MRSATSSIRLVVPVLVSSLILDIARLRLLTSDLRASKPTPAAASTRGISYPEEARMPTQNTEHRSYAEPDEVREFPNGKAEILKVGAAEIGRLILQPGWRWSNDVKPAAGTDLCEAPHMQYHVSGRLHIAMADGTEFEAVPG